jgi:23S rRNA pseudouridine2457 synthase
MLSYYTIHKPFQVLCQFSPQAGKQTLKDLYSFPSDIYPVGRLDYDSEGLIILTNDRTLNHRLLNPKFGHEREYWVQVEGSITEDAIEIISNGVDIAVDGNNYRTRKCIAAGFSEQSLVADRNPPIRYRKNIPTSWIRLILTEGKNRQVRKMTAAVGFPTLRLIRYRIQGLALNGMVAGDYKEWSRDEILSLTGLLP